MIDIVGASLASLAAGVRLAKAGHEVTIHSPASPHLPRDFAPRLTDVVRLPAAWRDVFTSTGRPLDSVLATHGFEFRPAPPTVHRFADGSVLELPDERGAQHHAIAATFGTSAADRWAATCDRLDDCWQTLRHFGLEEPFDPRRLNRGARNRLLADVTLSRLAANLDEPHLSRVLKDQAFLAGSQSRRAPALLGVPVAVERMFGRWYLARPDGSPAPATLLVELLIERASRLGVQFATDPVARPHIDATSTHGPSWRGVGRTWACFTPSITEQDLSTYSIGGVAEIIDHSDWAPVVIRTSANPVGSVLVADYRNQRRDLTAGLEPTSFPAWTWRARLRERRRFVATPQNHAGAEPWALVLTGSLAAYALHHKLTGGDISPNATFASRTVTLER